KKTFVPFEPNIAGTQCGCGCTGAAAPLVNAFPDVPSNYWAACPIDKLAMNNVVVGYPDRLFRPGRDVSRAEFATMMEGLRDILTDPEQREEMMAVVDEMFELVKLPIQKSKTVVGKNEVTPMVALNVKLILSKDKPVTRSFLVPLFLSFAALHAILQIGFGWYDSHLHRFSLKKKSVTIGMKMGYMGIEDDDVLDEEETMLSDFIPEERTFRYLYDFGDCWEHVIKVGKVHNVEGGPYVECTGGKGSTPPEDCGGRYGYDNLCEILGDPTCEEYEEMLEWAGDDFDAGFDKDFINKELGELKFVPHPNQ
ncbi:MAG: hypothetical protein EOM68_05965, partial [Spirochaetia bacterium]|nr:hypothetical protein [Spirochaetia bacterium]